VITDDPVLRGQEAERLLNSELLNEAFEKAEQAIISEWRSSQNPVVREQCHARVNAIDDLKRQLRIVLAAGEVAQRKPRKS